MRWLRWVRWVRWIGPLGVLAGTQGCDPCAGVVACEGAAAARVTGRIVRFPSGDPAPGVQIRVVASGSVASTTTDADGFWSVALTPPAGAGAALDATVTVNSSTAGTSYDVPHVRIPVSSRRGDGVDMARYYDRPYLRFIGQLNPRAGLSLGGASVRVDRVGGVDGSIDTAPVPVTSGGRFLVEGTAGALGVMLVRLTVTGPGLSSPFVIDSARPMTIVRDTSAGVQGTFSVGPGFLYRVRVTRRGNDLPLSGATVRYTRTGGVAWKQTAVSSTTDANGFATLPVVPLASGTVIGTLRITVSGFADAVIPGFQLPTVNDDVARLGGNFGIGSQVASVIDLYQRTSFAPLAAVPWTFTPTSGPLTETFSGVTDAQGAFSIHAPTNAAGTVQGDIAVAYLPPRAPEVLHGISITSAADDSVRLAANRGVGPSLLYAGILLDDATGAPVVAAQTEFRRTGGVPVRDSVYVWTTNEAGLFRIAPAPLADGNVVGNLTFRPPAPYRDTTFVGVQLPTFVSDETRPGPTFRIRRP